MEDRENRPYLDVIYHSMGIFYDHQEDKEAALDFYIASLEQNLWTLILMLRIIEI